MIPEPPPAPRFTPGPGGPDAPQYTLTGFPEFDGWCRVNHVAWSEFRDYGENIGATEEMVFRGLAAYLLLENLELQQKLTDAMNRTPVRVLVPYHCPKCGAETSLT